MNFFKVCLATICLTALCGCNQKPDPRLAKYEQRITALESNITELYQRNENRRTQFNAVFELQTNMLDIIQTNISQIPLLQLDTLFHQVEIEALQNSVSNVLASQPIKTGSRPMQYYHPQPGVMPSAVAAQIRAEAERRYPTDYDMQLFIIKQQSEAWYKLHP